MISKSFFLTCLPFLLLLTCCEKDEDKIILPEETSVGAQTFGCYVNNDLFVFKNRFTFLPSTIGADYYEGDGLLIISSIDIDKGYIAISDSIVEVGKTYRVRSATYIDEYKNVFTTNDNLFAEIYLTKFDTVNLIVSGRFSFKLKHEKSDSIVNVTKGRFDVKLFDRRTIINENEE